MIYGSSSELFVLELQIVNHFQNWMGVFLCESLLTMVQDMSNPFSGKQLAESFQQGGHTIDGDSISLYVLRSNHWPVQIQSMKLNPFPLLNHVMCKFTQLYENVLHVKRKLFWDPILSHGTLTVHMSSDGKKRFLKLVNMYVCSILFALLGHTALSKSQLFSILQLPPQHFDTLVALYSLKHVGLVQFIPDNNGNDIYQLVHHWDPPTRSVRLMYNSQRVPRESLPISYSSTHQDPSSSSTHNSSSSSSTHQHQATQISYLNQSLLIKATIVRILKRHNQMSFPNLVEKVNETLPHLNLSNNAIRKGLDVCLSQGYISRNPDNIQIFEYNP